MEAFGCHDVGLQEPRQRLQHRAARPYGVGHGREADRHAFKCIALGLTVQRLMLAELLVQNHRQQARSRPAPRNHMERRRRLADFLAIPASELFAHRLDHLPLARHRFQRPGHVFAELAQAIAAAAFTRRRRIDHHALAGKMIGERIAFGALARKSAYRRRPGDGSSRPQARLPWRWLPALRTSAPTGRSAETNALTAVRRSGARAWRSAIFCWAISALSSDAFAWATASSAAISSAFARSVANASFRAAMSSGRASRAVSMQTRES